MSSREGDTPIELATEMITGVSRMTTGVLFITAEAIIEPNIINRMVRRNDPRACLRRKSPISSRTPVRSRAADRMNIIAMVIGADELKTVRKSEVWMMPVARSTAEAASAVTSGG